MVQPNKYLKNIALPPRAHSIQMLGALRSRNGIFKLDSNEAVIPPSPKVIKAIISFLKEKNNLNWYPNPKADELKKEIAKYVGAKPNQILPTNGSEQALEFISNAYVKEGDEVVVPTPTFSPFTAWPISRGAKIVEVPYDIYSGPTAEAIQKKVTRKTKIIYLVNPYITTYPQKDIERIVQKNKHALVIVDEAYHEYYGKTSVGLVRRFDNIIITRTLSKTFMLAGLRLGFMVAREKTIENISKIIGLYNVNVLTHVAGIAALQDAAYTKKYAREVAASTKILARELPKFGFETVPTKAGFVLFRRANENPTTIQKKLESLGIFARHPFFKKLPSYLRMNVGNLVFTKKLITQFKKLSK